MKALLLSLLLLINLSAEDIKVIDVKPNWYTIYCINNTAWIEWKNSGTIVQMFTSMFPTPCKGIK